MDFFDRVKRLAKEKKYTSLQEFIISIGLNHDSYYSLKSAGNLPRADEALTIAEALETTVEYLVAGKYPRSLTSDIDFRRAFERNQDIHRKTSKKPR